MKLRNAVLFQAFLLLAAAPAGADGDAGVLSVIALGDSITAGGYPRELERMLKSAGIKAEVINMGVPGATSGWYARRLAEEADSLRRKTPRAVLLMLGTNDARRSSWSGPEGFVSGMETIVGLLRGRIYPGRPPEIIISTVLPVIPGKMEGGDEFLRRITGEINPAILSLSERMGLHLADNFKLFESNPELLADGIHPGAEGERRLAENWFGALERSGAVPPPRPRRTGIFYSDVFLRHDTGARHPERPDRLRAIMERFKEENLLEKLVMVEPGKAPVHIIAGTHTEDYLRQVENACLEGAPYIHSPDTTISEESYEAALHAAGAVLEAVGMVMSGELKNAFCPVRPPGHHAMRDRAMGFCLINNVAVGARHLLDEHGLDRVAIVDWDVHHGNGTQAAFYDDPRVLFISVHQHPFYPGTGEACERGAGEGEGSTLNIPLPPGAGDSEYIGVFSEVISPALMEFSPEFILISAGFDAHASDPLGGMNVSGAGFARMTRIIKDAAEKTCSGRVVSVLEGGYDLEALSESALKHVKVLAGE